MLSSGDLLQNRYEIINCIGSGGMADVYKAKDRKLNRYVAVKVMKPEFRGDSEFVSKFRVEAQAAAGLSHTNIVNVYDVGEDDGMHYIVMELVEGITLKEYIRSKGRLSVRETTGISLQVAAGLEAAHNNGIIHRDIKPQNIIMSVDGTAKVADFGIARAASADTINSAVMGSVHYSAPEQARGGYSDARSDIYSLGITMYEMLTGQVPFDGDSTVEVALKHLQQDIRSPREFVPDVPRAIEQIILKCTQKSPDCRYQNMGELIRDLKESLVDPNGDFVLVSRDGMTGSTQKYSKEQLDEINRRLGDGQGTAKGSDPYPGLFTGSYDSRLNYPPEDEDTDDYYEQDDVTGEEDDLYGGDLYGHDGDGGDASYPYPDDSRGTHGRLRGKNGGSTSRKKRQDPPRKKAGRPHDRLAVGLSAAAVVIVVLIILWLLSHTFGLLTGGGNGSAGGQSESSLVLDLTSDIVTVPDIRGMSESEAQSSLKSLNLGYRYLGEESSPDYKSGEVMSQDTEPGSKVKVNSTIGYKLSTGSAEMLTVPDLTDHSQKDAEEALTSMGLAISVDNTRYSDSIEAGYVITTNPGAGSAVHEGDTITLYISQGQDTASVKVPDVTGHYREDAVTQLTNYGLYAFVTTESSDTVQEGIVIRQDVKAGTSVQTGSSVTITVSSGPAGEDSSIVISPEASSSAASGTWRCMASLDAPEGYNGETVRITLEQNGTETEIYEGRTSFPYILNVEGIPGVSEGSAYVYVLDENGNEVRSVHYTGIIFRQVNE